MQDQHFQIGVDCYAGYRGEESPRLLHIGKREVEVVEVLDRWLAPDHRYFKLRGDDGGIYIIRCDPYRGGWELTLFDSGQSKAHRLSST
jgi:hypothetical protein